MSKFIAFDIETTGLYPVPGRDKIFGASTFDGKSAQVYTNIEQLRSILENPKITKVIHNGAFDCYWCLILHGIKVRNVWDTKLMEQLILGENLPRSNKEEELRIQLSSSLVYTLNRYGLADISETKHIGADFANKPKNEPLTNEERQYMMNDVRYLLALQAMQERRLTKLGLGRVANLENTLLEVVVDMRYRGIGFDRKVWDTLAKENSKRFNELQKRLPPQVSNWNSPAQVKKYFKSIGIPMDSITDAEELAPIYNNPVLNKFVEMRSLYKAVTTYGSGWYNDDAKGSTIDWDGRVRTVFEQMVNSGRFSSEHPNMQQIPRDWGHRKAFVPRKGCKFVKVDYPSQEIAIAAAASKEDRWIKAILRGDDIHSMTASIVFAEQWKHGYEKNCRFPLKCNCKIHKARRQDAKITNFTILYGGGEKNISDKTKMPRKEARKVIYKQKKSVPKLTRWLDKNAKTAVQTRISYSASPFKRRRTLRDPEDWMLANIGKNNPIQACGADMLKLAMVSIDLELCPLVHTEHDALVAEVPIKNLKKAAKHMKTVMEKAADFCTGIPGLLICEPEIIDHL